MLVKLLANCPQLQPLELREYLALRRIRSQHIIFSLRNLLLCTVARNNIEIHIIPPFLDTFYFFGEIPQKFLARASSFIVKCHHHVDHEGLLAELKQLGTPVDRTWSCKGVDTAQFKSQVQINLLEIFVKKEDDHNF